MCELWGFLSGSLLQTHGWLFLASRQDTEILPTLYWAAATPVCSGTEAATHTKRASLDIYAYALLFRPCHLLWIIFLVLLCLSIHIQFVSAAISAVILPHFYLVTCPCIFSATLFSIYSSSLLQNWAIYQYNWHCDENKIQYSLELININMQGSSNCETNLNKKAVWGVFGFFLENLNRCFICQWSFFLKMYLLLFYTYCQMNLSCKGLKTTGIMSVSVKTISAQLWPMV